jgi:segregation and condensation protein B
MQADPDLENVAAAPEDAASPEVVAEDGAAAETEPVQEELLDTGALQRNVEAVLFVASEAMSIKALAKLTGSEEADVTLALARIDSDFSGRGLVLREVAGGYRFASSPAARAAVEAYLLPPKTNLSPAALETLAIVAYNEPVTKTQVEEIRGVSADSVIATLLDRRFIAESGRKESPGRPMLYKTTAEFLEAFGLNSLGDLPAVDLDALQSREVELPMTQPLTETEDAAPEAAVAEEMAADRSAHTSPDQEAEELSLA